MLFPGDHVVEYVDAYLHDALPRHEAQYVAKHVKTCRVCHKARHTSSSAGPYSHQVWWMWDWTLSSSAARP